MLRKTNTNAEPAASGAEISSVPIVLQFRSGMSRLGFGFNAPRAKPEA